ncbi:MAG TPA: glycoside hydrolase family 43 protein [Edaphobacter sp.]|nr:glycoside hydrolase family 43 protein [Edaphobacter sp.]
MKISICSALVSIVALINPSAGISQAPSSQAPNGRHYLSQPLVTSIYTADPSAHVFKGKIYVYPSHDVPTDIPDDDLGSEYAMRDYRVLEMDRIGGHVNIGPVALDLKDVPWASKQLWAPDAAYRNNTYYLYFPARDKEGVFRIGVATSEHPEGPFKAEAEPMKGSFSIDPAVFTDADGQSYMYFGGIWGGQLENWTTGHFKEGTTTDLHQDDKPALMPKVAKLAPDMKHFAQLAKDVVLLDESGKPLLGGDHDRRFFEASWMFRRNGVYYFTYSTGDTHFLAYATGTHPEGPFQYKGHFLLPVQGWTTHHSIVESDGKWWLFYADTQLSNKNHLRNVKVTELHFNADGSIQTVDPFTSN